MKPDTINIFTSLAIKEVGEDLNSIAEAPDLFGASCATSYYRDAATNCRDIIEKMEALENLFLTAADEMDRIFMDAIDEMSKALIDGDSDSHHPCGIIGSEDHAAAESPADIDFYVPDEFDEDVAPAPSNMQFMTQEEHAEAHSGLPK